MVKKFWNLSFILAEKSYKLKNTSEIWEKWTLPALVGLYGSRKWICTQPLKPSLNIAKRKMERKTLQNIHQDNTKNANKWNKTEKRSLKIPLDEFMLKKFTSCKNQQTLFELEPGHFGFCND